MKKQLLTLSILPFLVACASAYKNEGDPESKDSYVIECQEATAACFEKAKEVCPTGYITKSVSAVGATSLLLFPTQLRTIEVRCKI